jgi:hypothetical protein
MTEADERLSCRRMVLSWKSCFLFHFDATIASQHGFQAGVTGKKAALPASRQNSRNDYARSGSGRSVISGFA